MKAVTLVQVHPRQPSKRTRNYCCRTTTKRNHLRQRQTVVTAPVVALCLLVSVVFFGIGWTIAGNAARGSWQDDVEALTFLRDSDSSKELNNYFGDSEDPRNWNGVTVTDGRVTGLTLEKCSSIDGLDAIGSIEELDGMSWCTRLVALPEAVRGLNALEELYFVDPANDNTGAAEKAGEVGTPTALPCFGGSGDTPSSPCPEPRTRNLRGGRH